MENSEYGKKLFCFLLSILTILNGYSFFVANGISIAMIVSSLYALYGVFFLLTKSKHIEIFFSYIAFIVVMSLLSFAFFGDHVDSLGLIFQVAKLAVWMLIITAVGSEFFDFNIFYRYMRIIVMIAFIYLTIQYIVFYVFSRSVPSAINLGVIVPYVEDYGYTFANEGTVNFRPGAMWVEPSFLGYYFNCFLVLLLFYKNKSEDNKKHEKLYEIIATLGIILSFSTGALGMLVLIYPFKMYKKSGNHLIFFLIGISIFLIAFFLFVEYAPYERWGTVGYVIKITLYKLQHLENNSRTGGSFSLLEDMPLIQKIIGFGIGNIKDYVAAHQSKGSTYTNSIVQIILWNGLFGIFAILVFFFRIFTRIKNDLALSVLFLIYILSGFYSGLYFSSSGILYLTIIMNSIVANGKTENLRLIETNMRKK